MADLLRMRAPHSSDATDRAYRRREKFTSDVRFAFFFFFNNNFSDVFNLGFPIRSLLKQEHERRIVSKYSVGGSWGKSQPSIQSTSQRPVKWLTAADSAIHHFIERHLCDLTILLFQWCVLLSVCGRWSQRFLIIPSILGHMRKNKLAHVPEHNVLLQYCVCLMGWRAKGFGTLVVGRDWFKTSD